MAKATHLIYGKNQYKILSMIKEEIPERLLLEVYSNPTSIGANFGIVVSTSKKDGLDLFNEATRKNVKHASFPGLDAARHGALSLLGFLNNPSPD